MKNQQKNEAFTRRAFLLGVGKLSLFSVLIARFAHLQVFSSTKYKTMAQNNSVKILFSPPPRGLLLDRSNTIIADNEFFYSAVLDSKYKNQIAIIVKQLNYILGYEVYISKTGIKRTLNAAGSNNRILLQNHLSRFDIAKIEVRTDLPGVEIIKSQKRRYVHGEIAAHITGYTSEPTPQELKTSSVSQHPNAPVGRTGIEKHFNTQLTGQHGSRKIEVNALGDLTREILHLPASQGDLLRLSIDLNLQKIVATHLQQVQGSAVILDAATGEILALHSSPSYDPNKFSAVLDREYWNQLKSDKAKPLINRAIAIPYPPGSTFKIFTALAILNCGISPDKKIFCSGEYQLGNKKFRCWNESGHGWVNLKNAIAKSCNTYFYTLGTQIGIHPIVETAKIFGLNRKTEIELPFEHQGLLPTQNWIAKKLKGHWNLGDTVNASVGQGYILATPLQLATALAKIATGLDIKPTILLNQNVVTPGLLNINDSHLRLLRESLFSVFNTIGGTGYKKAQHNNFTFSGKTGTAQVVSQNRRDQKLAHKMKDHGLFAGYVNFGNQIYSISVVIEHAGWGSVSALPIAFNIFSDYTKTRS